MLDTLRERKVNKNECVETTKIFLGVINVEKYLTENK